MKLPKVSKGFAGKVAEIFIHSKLTPVVVMVSLLLGLASVKLTPKEEEPQITVPMIDIMIPVPGMEAREVERNVTEPVERSMWGLEGVEYIYSMARPHGTLITVRFKVNEPIEPSLVKVHHKMMSIKNELPANVQQPDIKSYSIDDVPFLAVSFTSSQRNDFELRQMVATLARELSSTPDLAKVEILGGSKRSVRVIGDGAKLAQYGVTMEALAQALELNHALLPAGKNWSKEKVYDVEVGGKLSSLQDIKNLPIGSRSGRIVKMSDVASVIDGPEERVRYSSLHSKDDKYNGKEAVTISFAKRKGTNVVDLSQDLLKKIKEFKQTLPADVETTIIRNYGETAGDKASELIEHLIIATVSVTLLIALSMGWRAALVVAIAIPVTLSLTLAIYYFMGYTLNRVTLFALIFSIGILVDDAIVVVENIERYLKTFKNLTLTQATLRAVSEVGNPTVLATFTVIAAILPMSMVSGLMGPYMRPIPVGASMAMVFSLLVAFIVTPWAAVKLLKQDDHPEAQSDQKHGRLDALYLWITGHLLLSRTKAMGFGALVLVLLAAAISLVPLKQVKVKMLPFDDKNEFQVTLDYPVLTPLDMAHDWSKELAQELLKHPEVKRVQIFNGGPAPFSFSGMVKHTFLRKSDYMADLHVVLTHKHDRKIKSHDIINELRPVVKKFADNKGAVSKVLEIPPGPPVMASLVAEIYGKDYETRKEAGEVVLAAFAKEESIVDLDYSWRSGRSRLIFPYNFDKAAIYGTKAAQSWGLGRYIFNETALATLNDFTSPEEVSVTLSLDQKTRSSADPFRGQTFPSMEAGVVDPKDILGSQQVLETQVLHRKNLKPVAYVYAELAGADEAPIYGIMKIGPHIPYPTQAPNTSVDTGETIVKWDGEWALTQEVFSDLGVAFVAVMILIYILVVGWFKSFLVPLIIMAPIPISLIGIIPGHYFMGAYFSASSMIGFIAGGGVIVRNSIILLDFIEHQIKNGLPLKEAVLSAGLLRFRPMLLTASAVVVGSMVMLFDPIFQGLAISMMSGEIAATILSRFAVPTIYFWIVGERRIHQLTETHEEDNWGQ